MHNDPELSGKYLGTISSDFIRVADHLREASYQIRKAGFDFPIFAICRDDQPIGKIMIEKEKLGLEWNYFASFLDEFLQRDLVGSDKKEAFIESYKDPDEFCCLFVIDKDFTRFVYIPFPTD